MVAEDVLKPGTDEVICPRNTLLDEQLVEMLEENRCRPDLRSLDHYL